MSIAVIFPLVTPPFVSRAATRAFAKIDGREVFLRCVELYTPRDQVKQRIVVVTRNDLQEMQERFSAHLGFQGVDVTAGGSDWFSCVTRGIEKLKPEIDTVIVHDPCCPAVGYLQLNALEEALAKNKAAAGVVPVLPSRSAFADLPGAPGAGGGAGGGGLLADYVDMSKVVEVQSPQIFRRKVLESAYAARAPGTGPAFVDDAELVQSTGAKIATIPGSRFNIRIDSDDMVRLGKDLLEHMPRPKSRAPLNAFGEAEW